MGSLSSFTLKFTSVKGFKGCGTQFQNSLSVSLLAERLTVFAELKNTPLSVESEVLHFIPRGATDR